MRFRGALCVSLLLGPSVALSGLRFQPLVLDQLGYAYSQPRGINDHGTVVGVVQNSMNFNDAPSNRAVVWDAQTGSAKLLGAPPDHTGSTADDINNHGVIVGSVSTTVLGRTRAMRYTDGSFYLPSTSPGKLNAINDRFIEDADVVMRLHLVGDTSHHCDRFWLVRLINLDDLESAGKRSVLLEIFLIFGPSRGRDRSKLSASECGLE